MENNNKTPKSISKRRLAKSKLMRVAVNEGNFDNKENVNPTPIPYPKKTSIVHDRKFREVPIKNPFDLPDHMRLFSKRKRDTKKVRAEPFIMNDPKTICDLDNTFYKVIEGRPLRQFTDVKVYMNHIRDITLNKANAAYLKDQIIQIDTSFVTELEEYNKIDKLYLITKANFVKFAKESYDKAKKVQALAEIKSQELSVATEQMEAYSFEYVKLRNQLSSIQYSFEILTRYGKFLNFMSPDSWREQFDYLNRKKEPEEMVAFTSSTENAPLTAVTSIDEYKTSVMHFEQMKPKLYFRKPKEIMNIYEDLSRQCMNYMQIDVVTTRILTTVQKGRDELKAEVTAEISEMEDFINIYEANVKFLEQKADDYKEVFDRVLLSEFQTLYSSTDTTKLFTCVQYVNTQIFGGPEDPKDSVLSLMREIERLNVELTSGLDSLNQEVVKAATHEFFSEDIAMMNRAHKAQRSLKECDILKKALFTSFEAPRARRKVTFKKSKDNLLEN